jgi:15-cis-phytoene synthase
MTSMIRSDALHCERIVRRRARTFTLASYFLPTRKRRASFAIYAFRHAAYDIIRNGGNDRKAIARNLLSHRRDLAEAVDGRPRGPILRELRWAMREFNISRFLMFELLEHTYRSASPPRYETWEEFERDFQAEARTVGAICGQVCGIPGGAKQEKLALEYARTLGLAMQLTNVLRDAGQDALDGHCNLPDEELARFSLTRDEVTTDPELVRDPRWNRLMTFETGRARSMYAQALPGIALLSEDSQRCAAACAIGYAAILDALEHMRYDALASRASVGTIAKLGVLWDAWRFKGKLRAIA